MRENGVVYWLHGDHLGSASLTTDINGGIYAQQRYFPYGEVRWQSGSLPTDRQFTGQRREAALGIYDYKARFYSPRLGRFLSADTLVPGVGSQHLSRYMYVTGNPARYDDPTGHARPTEESENYGDNKSIYPGLPGWYEAGQAYQEYLRAKYQYADNPAIVADYQAGFEQARSRARAAMPQVLWTEDNVVSLYDAAGTVGVGMAACWLSGSPDPFAPRSSVPESLRSDAMGDPDCVGCGYKKPGQATSVQPLGRGSTGRTEPQNLKEQLAMEEVMSDPQGKTLGINMSDPRWPAAEGWVKRSQFINGIEIHYVYNTCTGEYDDFKFKEYLR